MLTIYLVSYSPLANTRHGRTVAATYNIPRYVDASCRREPDFELAHPFVSGLCRPDFVASIRPLDVLVYVTNKRKIHPDGRRLVAVLKLEQQFKSHQYAAAAYKTSGQRIPYSCIVPWNPCLPIQLTDPKMTRSTARFTDSNLWDRAVYMPRARQCIRCFSSEPLFIALCTPPTVKDEFWIRWFGCDPGQKMQNRGLAFQKQVYDALLCHTGIESTGIMAD